MWNFKNKFLDGCSIKMKKHSSYKVGKRIEVIVGVVPKM
jgi:hypothetical protein